MALGICAEGVLEPGAGNWVLCCWYSYFVMLFMQLRSIVLTEALICVIPEEDSNKLWITGYLL